MTNNPESVLRRQQRAISSDVDDTDFALVTDAHLSLSETRNDVGVQLGCDGPADASDGVISNVMIVDAQGQALPRTPKLVSDKNQNNPNLTSATACQSKHNEQLRDTYNHDKERLRNVVLSGLKLSIGTKGNKVPESSKTVQKYSKVHTPSGTREANLTSMNVFTRFFNRLIETDKNLSMFRGYAEIFRKTDMSSFDSQVQFVKELVLHGTNIQSRLTKQQAGRLIYFLS